MTSQNDNTLTSYDLHFYLSISTMEELAPENICKGIAKIFGKIRHYIIGFKLTSPIKL